MKHDRQSALLVNGDAYTARACRLLGLAPVLLQGPRSRDWDFIHFSGDVETLFVEDPASLECLLAALTRAGLRDRSFACVQTSDEGALVTAAALGRLLGVPGLSPHVAVSFRDKWLQKQIVAGAGVPVPRSVVVEDVGRPEAGVYEGFTKAVLKPIAGAGTEHTLVVRTEQELVEAGRALISGGTSTRTFVLEEFVDGDEWLVDGVVHDGAVQFYSLGRYAQPCLRAVDANSVVQIEILDPTREAEAYALARPVVEASLRALDLTSGVFHMELFERYDGQGLVFSECAARPGGALQQEAVHYKFGVDLALAAVSCAAGRDPEVRPSPRPESVGSTFLGTRPGVLVGCPTREEVLARPGVEYVRLEFPYGSVLPDVFSGSSDGAGQVMVTGRTPEEFRERRDALLGWFHDRLQVAPLNVPRSALRAWQASEWPGSTTHMQTYGDVDVATGGK